MCKREKEMKRQTRTTKQIIKAVSVGLSASMLLQPVTAMADGLDENAPVLPDVEEKEEIPYVNAGDESCESENIESLENAKELLDDAEKKEDATEDAAKKLEKEPSYVEEDIVLEIIENLEDNDIKVPQHFWDLQGKDVDDSAKEFDEAAEKHVEDAINTLEDAEKTLTGDPEAKEEEKQTGILDQFEENIQNSEQASFNSVEEAAKAAAELLKAGSATVSANEATSSEEAKKYAEVAKQAAENAKNNSVSSNEFAANALEEYNNAKIQLDAAKEAAKKANDAANKALELGLEDAEDAVAMAKAAEKAAESLEAIVNSKKEAADAYVSQVSAEITRITDEINELTNNINSKKNDKKIAEGDVEKASGELLQKFVELKGAEWASVFMAPSKWDIAKMESDLKNLKTAMDNAEKALAKLKGEMEEAGKDNETAKKTLSEATEAYNEIKDAYNKAVADVKAASEKETELNGTVSELKKQYGDDIMDKQKALREAETDEAKTAAAKALIEYVMGAENASVITYEAIPNGIFMIKNGEVASYYTYEIDDKGVITIKNCTYEVIEGTTQAIEEVTETDLTEEEKEALVKKLEDGSFFVKVKSSETVYEITYKENYGLRREGLKGFVIVNGERVTVECRQYYNDMYYWWFPQPDGTYRWVGEALENKVYLRDIITDKDNADWWFGMYDWFYEDVKMVEITTNTYDVTSNVNSKIVTKEEMQAGEWLYYEDASTYKLNRSSKAQLSSHNRAYDKAPEMVGENFEKASSYKYNYKYNDTITVDNGNLKWDPNANSWVLKGYLGHDYWEYEKSIHEYYRYTIKAYQHDGLENLTKEQADAYGYGRLEKTEQYRVYYNKTESQPGETSYTVGNNAASLADIAAELGAISQAIITANGVIDANKDVVENYNKAVKAAKDADDKYQELVKKYNKASKDFDDENYQYRINNLDKQIRIAKSARDAADNDLKNAQKAYYDALGKWGAAAARLDAINGQIAKLEGLKTSDKAYRAGLYVELNGAKSAAKYWADKLDKVGKLEDKAEEARIAAEKARDALKLLQNTSNVGEEAIKKAEAELALALADYEEADRLAKLAIKDAEDAETAYNNILDKIEELLTEEARRRGSDEGGDEGGETTPTTPAPGTILVAQAGPAVVIPATATATAGAPEDTTSEETADNTTQQTITENLVPMAAAPTGQTINEQDVPLAPMDEQAKMSWWWIIAVLVLGTTGAELLRRRMVKKNTATLESTKSDK